MIFYILFTISLFIFLLNGFLRGKLKEKTDVVMFIILLIIIILGIYYIGWVSLIYFLTILLIGGNFILTPLAKLTAKKLLS